MMNNQHKFEVTFEKIMMPMIVADREELPVRSVTLVLMAPTIEEAITLAWQTVTLSTEEYQISKVELNSWFI